MSCPSPLSSFFFFNDTATTEIYTLSLHDALPISPRRQPPGVAELVETQQPLDQHQRVLGDQVAVLLPGLLERSEEHTSELQSQSNLVCRLLLAKKKKNKST